MNARLSRWLHRGPDPIEKQIIEDIFRTFSTDVGQRTMDWMLNTFYFPVCSTSDHGDLAAHNGARDLIREILERYDMAVNPQKQAQTEVESNA